jgi:tetratricopeptide (TPR) repeat protein
MVGDNIDYWAHVGGYLCGFGLGYLMGLHKAAAEEAVHNKAEKLAQRAFKTKEALTVYGQILEKEPENETALLYHFNKYSLVQSEKTTEYFCRLVGLYTKKEISKAIELVDDHFPKYLNALRGDVLLKIGVHYARIMDFKKARLCLKLAKDKEGPWQAKAMLTLSDVYVSMDVPERAEILLRSIINRFPETMFQEQAELKLSKL